MGKQIITKRELKKLQNYIKAKTYVKGCTKTGFKFYSENDEFNEYVMYIESGKILDYGSPIYIMIDEKTTIKYLEYICGISGAYFNIEHFLF